MKPMKQTLVTGFIHFPLNRKSAAIRMSEANVSRIIGLDEPMGALEARMM